MNLRLALFLSLLMAASPSSLAQKPEETPTPNSSVSKEQQTTDPNNKRVRVTHFTIPPGQNIELPALANEGLTICLRGDTVSRIPTQGQEERWAHGPGSVVLNRSGVAYTMLNNGESPAEILVIELKDTYAMNQLRVPWSDRDPVNQDPGHFRPVLENTHARVLLMHLNPGEGTVESQFADRLEIALTPQHESMTDVDGKTHEMRRDLGSVLWDRAVMYSTVNLGEQPLDRLIVELKHPFCYEASENDMEMGDAPQNMKTYLAKVKETIGKNWNKHMPGGVRTADDRGLVVLQVKISADGTLPEDSMRFRIVYASDSLMEKALSAVHDTSPFPPFPPDAQKPSIELRLFFAYNMPRRPPGCY